MFCLQHVRAYNAQWNFHEGLDSEALEQEYRSAATWDRPTWKLGQRLSPGRPWHGVFDPFDLFKESGDQARRHTGPNRNQRHDEEVDACKVLGLTGPFTAKDLKARYKSLVKKHHPDANGGSDEAADRMKAINAAYQTLRAMLASN